MSISLIRNSSHLMNSCRVEDGARALPADQQDVTLRHSVTSLVSAMRDLLNNIRLPDVPNDADVDDNDDSDEDDQNNYLT